MRELLDALWPVTDRDGSLTVWTAPGNESLHLPIRRLSELGGDDVAELAQMTAGKNVYFGLGLRVDGLESDQQGRKDDIVALPGFAVDIDFFNPDAHKASNLPRDLEEAACLLEDVDPSLVVDTGNGVHVYVLFREPMEFATLGQRQVAQRLYRRWQEPIIKRAAERGWHVDSTATIQRVWRLPGFVNVKTKRRVELLYCDPQKRFSITELGLTARVVESVTTTPTVPTIAPLPPAEGDDNPTTRRVREVLSHNHGSHSTEVEKILRGESFAERGQRDDMMQRVCSVLAGYREFWDLPAADVVEVLRPSLSRWASEDDATKTVDEEMEKASDKYERSRDDLQHRDRERLPMLQGLARALGLRARGEDEDEEGDGEEEKPDYILQHTIAQFHSTYYVYDFTKQKFSYRPHSRDELPQVARDAWNHGNAPEGLSLHYWNEKQQKKTKTAPRLLEEYATVVDHCIGDMTRESSFFDVANSTYFEVMGQKRVREAEFNPRIDEWLRLFAGNKYEKLCDWMAVVPDLSCVHPAIYFDGASHAGKDLFSNGLARLWHLGSPIEFANVLDNFNSPIKDCPLLWINEGGVPEKRGSASTKIRSWITATAFELREKFQPTRIVRGSIRLIICANNQNAVDFGGEQLTVNDLDAVVGRLLHVPVTEAAANWLKKNNVGQCLSREWVEGDGLARHCLWLAKERRGKIKTGSRFVVEGEESSLHRNIVLSGDVNALIYEWLARFATNPNQVNVIYRGKQTRPLARIGDGVILVNNQCLIDCWETYMGKRDMPSTTHMSRGLRSLAVRVARLGSRGDRSRYYVIEPHMVLEWCRQRQIGNEDEIEANLEKSLDVDGEEIEEMIDD